jgi:hypothetical protein
LRADDAGSPRKRRRASGKRLIDTDKMEAAPSTGIHRNLSGGDICGETRSASRGGGENRSKEEGKDVPEERELTRDTMACSEKADETHGGRNRRRSLVAGAQNWRAWRRYEAPELDSFDEENKANEAELWVPSAWRGEAGIDGTAARRRCTVGFLPFSVASVEEKKRGGKS